MRKIKPKVSRIRFMGPKTTRSLSSSKFITAALRYQWLNHVNEYPALPPILNTETTSTSVLNAVVSRICKADSFPKKTVGRLAPAQYRVSRFDGKIRFMEMPHPVPYFFLIHNLDKHWRELLPLISSESSRIRPKNYPRDQRIVLFGHDYGSEELLPFTLDNNFPELEYSLSRGIVVQLDISNFFPSIYTHAIDWAVSGGRSHNRGPGSEIDKSFQRVRTNRTDGISIGPVTSNVAAEVILSDLDKELSKLEYPVLYSRAIDDLTILIPSNEDPDELSNLVSKELSKVGLALNHAKTKITPLKSFYSQHISKSLTQVTDLISGYPSKKKLRQAFSSLYVLADEKPANSLVKYGWKLIRSIVDSQVQEGEIYILRYFIILSWEMATHYPHMVPSVVAETIFRQPMLNGDVPEQFLLDFLMQELPKGITDISAWLLFYCYDRGIDPTPALVSIDFFNSSNLADLRSTSIDAFIGCVLLAFQDCEINERLVEIFTDPDYFSDDRTEKWSDYWPVRYMLYKHKAISEKQLNDTECKAFDFLNAEGFSLIRESNTDYKLLLDKFREC